MIDLKEAEPDDLKLGAWAEAESTGGAKVQGRITSIGEGMIYIENIPLALDIWIHWNVERPKKYLPITPGSVIKWWPDWEDQADGHLIMVDEHGNWGSAQFQPREEGINHYEIIHVQTQDPS